MCEHATQHWGPCCEPQLGFFVLTHKCIFLAVWLHLRCRPCLRINLPNEPCCGVTWTYSWCRFLIKTVPLGSNWCYLRLGRSRMGGKREVRLRWYRGWGDRKHLSNLVRLEIGAAIEPKGLSCAALLCCCRLLFCRSRDVTWVFTWWKTFVYCEGNEMNLYSKT